jgi:hypothetical protein
MGSAQLACLGRYDDLNNPDGGGSPQKAGEPVRAVGEMNEPAILASVANGAYRYSTQFTPLNRVPYASAIADGAPINVWVTTADYLNYGKIVPDKNGSGVALPSGAMVVREVLGKDGGVTKLTLMVKGPKGYNPDLGDFWFGVTDPDGTPQQDANHKLTGKLSQCYSCHIPRANDGFLFGVPDEPRMPPATADSPPPATAPQTGKPADSPPPARSVLD